MNILVTDFDKTFYINEEDLIKNINLIKEFRKNNLFIISTGRSFHDFLKYKEKYNIEYDYLIINHGATILNKNDDVLFSKEINGKNINKIYEILKEKKITEFFCCSEKNSRVGIKDNNLTKIFARYENKAISDKMNDIINNNFKEDVTSYSVNNMVEIISSETSKCEALKFLINNFDYKDKNIFVIGDNYNDYDMVKEFNGYAMENAVLELKNIARKTYESVGELICDI